MTPLKRAIPFAFTALLFASGAALADDDDCRSPMADWQSRDAAIAHVQQLGLSAERLKVDDGCYEVRGRDSDGNRVELKLEPATLALVELKVGFRPGSNPSLYLPGALGMQAAPVQAPVNNPLFTPGSQPNVKQN